MAERTLKDRVSDRLLELGINAFEAARRGELGREYINDILKGRKHTVRGDNLIKLAVALDVEPRYLLGSADQSYDGFAYPKSVEEIALLGAVSQDIWRSLDKLNGYKSADSDLIIPSDLRFPTSDQVDFEIEDDSHPSIGSRGTFLRCIKAEKWSSYYPTAVAYVVRETKGDLFRTYVKVLKPGERSTRFAISSERTGESEQVGLEHPFDELKNEGGSISTVAVVLYSYRPSVNMR